MTASITNRLARDRIARSVKDRAPEHQWVPAQVVTIPVTVVACNHCGSPKTRAYGRNEDQGVEYRRCEKCGCRFAFRLATREARQIPREPVPGQ